MKSTDCSQKGDMIIHKLRHIEGQHATTRTAVHVNTFLGENKADQLTAEGKGRTEAIVGIQANFVFT